MEAERIDLLLSKVSSWSGVPVAALVTLGSLAESGLFTRALFSFGIA